MKPEIHKKMEVKSMYQIKDRLKALGKTQVWLILELRKRGVEVQPPLMSSIINGVYTYPQAQRVLKVCDEVLKDVENGTN